MNRQPPPHRILLGRIIAAHGVRGEVLIKTFTGDPAAIAAYGALSDMIGARSFKVRVIRTTPKGVVARIDGVTDRTAAEAAKGTDLYVERARLPAAGGGEYYHADLIGLEAVAPGGESIGTIIAIENFGAGDLLEVRLANSRSTEFIPFTDACVPNIDIAGGRATIVMPTVVGEPEPPNPEEPSDDA